MPSELRFAAIADDDTGASDLAGMFASRGARMILLLDVPPVVEVERWAAVADGIVFATATRALPVQEAKAKTRAAMERALACNARTIAIKYCSTFDSTEQGNIGPSLDVAMEVSGEEFAIAVPALPINGRTTYLGHHFVNGQLLAESPMRNHPLNPMTDSNLVRWLSRQTSSRVALTPLPVVDDGPAAISAYWDSQRAEGIRMSVVDCVSDKHARDISVAASGRRLISGSSVFGMYMQVGERHLNPLAGIRLLEGRGRLVVAGSRSVATERQNAWLERQGFRVLKIDPVELMEGSGDVQIPDGDVLVKLPADVNNARVWGESHGLSPAALGLRLADALAAIIADHVVRRPPSALVIAGGETSSALCRALGLRALGVGPNIQPGVPLCVPLDGPAIPVVLKSGNFGSEDFYAAAFEAAGRLRIQSQAS